MKKSEYSLRLESEIATLKEKIAILEKTNLKILNEKRELILNNDSLKHEINMLDINSKTKKLGE